VALSGVVVTEACPVTPILPCTPRAQVSVLFWPMQQVWKRASTMVNTTIVLDISKGGFLETQ
jgi:hypothetical protein